MSYLFKIFVYLYFVALCNAASCSGEKPAEQTEKKNAELGEYFGSAPAPSPPADLDRGPDLSQLEQAIKESEKVNAIEISMQKTNIVVGSSVRLRVLGITSDNRKLEVTNKTVFKSASPEIADFSDSIGGLIIGKKVGTAELTATYDGLSAKAKIDIDDILIEKIELSPRTIVVGTTQQFYATGILSDGTTQDLTDSVKWLTANSLIVEPAKDSKSGVFIAHRAGKTNIGVEMNGRTANSAIEANLMNVNSISVQTENYNVLFGTSVAMKAIGSFANGTSADITGSVSWKSLNRNLAKVSDELATKGVVSTLSSGDAVISASFGDVSGSAKLKITAVAFASMYFEPSTIRVPKGKKEQIKVFGIYPNGSKQEITRDVIWRSSKQYLAAPSNLPGEEGLLETFDIGDLTITATYGDSTIEAAVDVTEATIIELKIQDTNTNVICGLEPTQLKAMGLFSDGTSLDVTSQTTWESQNITAAIVSNDIETKGLVTTIQPGAAIIKASIVESVLNKTITAEVTFAINQPILKGYVITSAFDSIPVGSSMQMYAMGDYTCVKNPPIAFTNQVIWSISDLTNAEILNAPSKGLFKTYGNVVSPVQVTVTVTKDNISATKKMIVREREIVSISLTTIPAADNINVGESRQLYIRALYSDNSKRDITDGSELTGSTVSWSASQPLFLMVNNDESKGVITAVTEGAFRNVSAVLSTSDGKSFNASASFSVRSPCSTGRRFGTYCWFISDVGQSCTEKCTSLDGEYVDADVKLTGSAGTSANCLSALNLYGYFELDRDDQTGPGGVGAGCGFLASGSLMSPRRYTMPDTNGNEKHPNLRRMCSCRD